MTTLLTSSLLFLTILAAFAFGIASGYWAICGFLRLLNSSDRRKKLTAQPVPVPVLASSVSGD
jgi:hypothetical protein